jgi:hypothetical protein
MEQLNVNEMNEMHEIIKETNKEAYVRRFFNELMAFTETYTHNDALETLEHAYAVSHPNSIELDSRFKNECGHKCLCGKRITKLYYFYSRKVNKKIIIGCICVDNIHRLSPHKIFEEALFDKCEVCEKHQIPNNKYYDTDFKKTVCKKCRVGAGKNKFRCFGCSEIRDFVDIDDKCKGCIINKKQLKINTLFEKNQNRILLDVKYEHKEIAKTYGARWCNIVKKWYVTKDNDKDDTMSLVKRFNIIKT